MIEGVAEIAAAIRARKMSAAEVVDAYLARIEKDKLGCFYRVDPTARGSGARRRREDRARRRSGAARRRAGGAQRSLRHRKTSRPPRAARSSKAGCRRTTARRRSDCKRRARCSSASCRWTSSRWARRTRTRRTGRCAIRGIPTRVPGGSSGGSAAAVAAGLVAGALGTDTGGSIRQPAALTGTTGLKPTYGRVSRYGVVAFASSLDQVGPFGRSALDCAHLLEAIAGHDPHDATSLTHPVPDYRAACARPLGALRIGVPSEYFKRHAGGDGVVGDGGRRRAVQARRDQGVHIELPHTELRHRGLLHRRDRGSVVQPGALRRRALRPPRRRRQPRRDVRAHARGRLRRRGQAPHHARHLRAAFGLLRRLLLARAKGADADQARLRARVRSLRRHRHADRAVDGVQARRQGRRSARDVLERRLHDPVQPRGRAGHVVPCGFIEGLPVGLAAARPAARRGDAVRRRRRVSARDRLAHAKRPRRDQASKPVIGLEVHVQLQTRTKAFTSASAEFGGAPNTHVDPYSLALPGTLPVLSRAAVESAMQARARRGVRHRAARALRAQALLLPGFAEGLSDLAARRAALPGRPHRVRARRRSAPRAPQPHSHGRGRGQEHARAGRVLFARRLQPLRRAARRDRVASPTCARPPRRRRTCAPSASSCAGSGSATATWKRARCAATPTSACGPPASRSSAPRPSSRT